MQVKMIRDKSDSIPESLGIHKSQVFISKGNEYEVHAILIFKGKISFQIVDDDLEMIHWYPSWFFEISESMVPDDWVCCLPREDVMVFGPEFVAADGSSYDRMVELYPESQAAFWRRVDESSRLPPDLDLFREMSEQELKDYFRWFFSVLPQKIQELIKAVNETPGYTTWQPDYTPASLDELGAWFANQVKTRPLTSEEIEEIKIRLTKTCLTFPLNIPHEELTNHTFSLAMDIGMYLSQVFVKNHPSLHWEQLLEDKNHAYYGQTVLIGFGSVPFNPVHMAVILAYSLANKTRTGKRLREIYDHWVKKIKTANKKSSPKSQ